MRHYILDADNHTVEVDLLTWAEWKARGDQNCRVDFTQVNSECSVSTVFMGLDHRYFGEGPPVLFETMIFGGPPEIDERQWRWCSWDDAEVGHKTVVRIARAACGIKVKDNGSISD